ncbi:Protein efr3 [Smittium culicis]|uniref:Protein efr3 n=1 Tax=Smittium culicis TaxID=133412 RepID=A0A1R1X6G7_9FUNG|nr:Protein efr3 [Smittium culicis]
MVALGSSCLPIDQMMFYLPFRRYFKHATLIEKCFPIEKNAEPKPLSNGLSYLTYYTRSKPVKLAKVGKYLYKRLVSDIGSKRYNDVLIELQIFDALIDSNSRDIGFFGSYLMQAILITARSKNSNILWHSAQTFCSFCKHHASSSVVIADDIRSYYSQVVDVFSQFLSADIKSESTQNVYHAISLKVLYSVAKCQDTYIGDGLAELNKVISSVLKRMWLLFISNNLPSISLTSTSDFSTEFKKSPLFTLEKLPLPDLISFNPQKFPINSSPKPESSNLPGINKESNFLSVNEKNVPPQDASSTHSISLSDSENALSEIFNLSINDIINNPDSNVVEYLPSSIWYVLSSIVESSYRSNLRLIVLSFFNFMEFSPDSWNCPEFSSTILSFVTSIITPQYRSVIITETLIYLEKSSSSVPTKPSSQNMKTQLSIVSILDSLVNGPIVLVGISVLEVLSKLVNNLLEVAKLDNCTNIDLAFSISQQPFSPTTTPTNINSLQSFQLTRELLDTIISTIGGLVKSQYYENQDADFISYISQLIDIDLLLNESYKINYPKISDYSTSIDKLHALETYPKSIWLLKSIRLVVSNLLKVSLDLSSPNNKPNSHSLIKSGISFSLFKPFALLLSSIDPQIRILSAQILSLAYQYNSITCKPSSINNRISDDFFSQKMPNFNPIDNNSAILNNPSSQLRLQLNDFSSQFDLFDSTDSFSNKNKTDLTSIDKSNYKLLTQFSASPFHSDLPKSLFNNYTQFPNDPSFFNILYSFLYLLVNSLVTPFSVCDFLIAGSFLSTYITADVNSNPESLFSSTTLKVIDEIYQQMVPCYNTAIELANSSPTAGTETSTVDYLSFPTANSSQTENSNDKHPEQRIPRINNHNIASEISQVSSKPRLAEIRSFLNHFCYIQTIYSTILNKLSISFNSQAVKNPNPAYTDSISAFSTYVSDTISSQKLSNCWKSEIDLDLFNPILSWLTKEKQFAAPSKDVTFWDYSKIVQSLNTSQSSEDSTKKIDIRNHINSNLSSEFVDNLAILYPSLEKHFKSRSSGNRAIKNKSFIDIKLNDKDAHDSIEFNKLDISFNSESNDENSNNLSTSINEVNKSNITQQSELIRVNSSSLFPTNLIVDQTKSDGVYISRTKSINSMKSIDSISINDKSSIYASESRAHSMISNSSRNLDSQKSNMYRHELGLGLEEFEIEPENKARKDLARNLINSKSFSNSANFFNSNQSAVNFEEPGSENKVICASDLKSALADGFNTMNSLLEMKSTKNPNQRNLNFFSSSNDVSNSNSRSGVRSKKSTKNVPTYSPSMNNQSIQIESGSEYSLDLTVDPEYTDTITNDTETKMVFDYLKI